MQAEKPVTFLFPKPALDRLHNVEFKLDALIADQRQTANAVKTLTDGLTEMHAQIIREFGQQAHRQDQAETKLAKLARKAGWVGFLSLLFADSIRVIIESIRP